jgi:hypothetical protein
MTIPYAPEQGAPVGSATKQTIEPGKHQQPTDPIQAEGLATLQALRKSDKILYARNVSDKPISCRERNGSINVDFMLEMGELAIIPKEALYVRGFIKCWQRKELIIGDDESMENQFLLDLDGRVTESQAMQQRAVDMMMPNPANNDILQKTCLLPHYGMPEGAPVMQRAKDAKEGVPPLCDQHKNLTHQFVGTRLPDGTWDFKQMTGLNRG